MNGERQADAGMDASAGQVARSAESFPRAVRNALLAAVLASALGLGANALSPKPVPILSADGPGALPELWTRITLSDVERDIEAGKRVFLLDVRREPDFEHGHAANSTNAPAEEFMARFPNLSLGVAESIVIVCYSAECIDGDRIAKTLGGLNFKNIFVLEGGWQNLRTSKLEIVGSRE